MPFFARRFLPFALSLLLPLSSFAAISANEHAASELTYTPGQAKTAVEIVNKLATQHYRNQPFDDQLSSKYLEQYLKTLDPAKLYFLDADVKQFEKHRYELDDQLKAGDLDMGFSVYRLYQERVSSRLNSLLKELEDPSFTPEFNTDEVMQLDREDAAWPKDAAEASKLWKKRVTQNLLALVLSGKTLEEAKTTLAKRYRSQLKRLDQQTATDIFETYINALTLLYDPHTNYFAPRTAESFNINMSLSLEGIGAVLQAEDEFTKVVRLVPAGPADRQGELKPADKIIGVGQGEDGEVVDVVGWRLDDVVQLIRGPKNTMVRLEIVPSDATSDEVKTIKINRGKVKLEEQSAQKAVFDVTDGNNLYKIGVIDVPAFYIDFEAYRKRDPNYKSTTADVYRLLDQLQQENVDGVILDLRNNGGGSLQEATMLTDLFIDEGPVVQIRQTNQTISRHSRSRSKARYRGPLIVLVNHLSASASEIFAGAIQDYNRGLIVGAQSFGKGTVQSLNPVQEGQLKITESKFYRVSGESTQHRGVVPDIDLPMLVDPEEVGESSYDTALPWDQIHAVAHSKYYDINKILPQLREEHKERAEKDPDIAFLIDQLGLIKESRARTSISLNKQKREAQQKKEQEKLLVIENKRRTSKGLPVYANYDELKKADEAESKEMAAHPGKIVPEKDPLLMETGYIMADYIRMLNTQTVPQLANF